MVKTIYSIGTDPTNTPSNTTITQTSRGNLDVCVFRSTQLLDLVELDEIEFLDLSDNVIFTGYVREIENGSFKTTSCFDYGVILGEIPIRHNFENMTPVEIIEYVIETYTPFTFSASSAVSAITFADIVLYPSRNRKAIEIIDDMHSVLGTTHYVDKDKVFHLEFEGDETNPLVLTVGFNCATDETGWVSDTSQLAKGVIVNGDNKRIEEIEFKSGNGSQTEFTLTNPYTDIKVEYPVGTALSPQVDDISSGDYKIYKETKKIVFNSAPASGTNNIKIYYVYNIQTNFSISSTSIYDNPHTKVINKEFLKEVSDCKKYAEKYYDKFKNPLRNCRLFFQSMDITLFRANQRIRVVDNLHKVNGAFVDDFFVIKEIKWKFGEEGASLELLVGDSDNIAFDKNAEIRSKIIDLNELYPIADIFNEGIQTIGDNLLNVEFETIDVKLYKADLPSNVLVFDAGRKFDDDKVFINESDYLDLFEEIL